MYLKTESNALFSYFNDFALGPVHNIYSFYVPAKYFKS